MSSEPQSPMYMSESRRSRDMSVSTGRSPTPTPQLQRGEPTTSGPPHESSTVHGEGPDDATPMEGPEHEPVIITEPSRSEAALHRPPPAVPPDEEVHAHTVSYIDHEEESSSTGKPTRPIIRDSAENVLVDSEGRHSPHPEVHRVHDDRPVAGPSPTVPVPAFSQPTTTEHPVSVPVSTRPTSAEHRESAHVPREATATPLDLGTADGEDLNEVAEQPHSTLIVARDARERREAEFLAQEDSREDESRRHEGDRQHYFEEGEERDAEARQRSDGIWQELETRLKALPFADADEISSIRDMAQQAASLHAKEILETVRLEREEPANERKALAEERAELMSEISAQKDAIISEKDARIAALEDELTRARAELDAEQQRVAEDSETRERQREELIERDENIRGQLGDITNLVQDQRDMCETKKALMDARWEEKQNRREDKNARMIELRDMIQAIHDNMDRDRSRCEDERRESQNALQKIIDELRAENAQQRIENTQQREILSTLSDSWRANCETQPQKPIKTVKSTANEQVPFNVQRYLNDFSKALATEVRMLLAEVGRIREEKRALQHEIGELLSMKSKYGPGGEFEPDWTPPGSPPAGHQPTPNKVPPIPDPTEPPIIRPGWRAYLPRPRKKKKELKIAPVPAQPPQAGPSHMNRHLRQQVTSWATWHPDPDVALTPPSVEPTLMLPDRSSPGLFGPRTPSSSIYDEPGTHRR